MPRTKKQLENNFPPESHPYTDEPVEIVTNEFQEPDESEPIAEETHRVVRTWKKKVPVETPQIIEVTEPDEIKEEKSLDPLDEFLAEVGATSSETVTMTVWRLPLYWKDSNASPSAEKVCLDTIKFERETYVKTIQERFVKRTKHNDFLIAIRRNGRIRAYLPVLRLETDHPEPAEAEASGENDALPVGMTRDPVQDFDKMVRNMKRWNESLGIVTGMQAQQPAAPPEPPEITTDQALMKLASEDPEQLARIRDRIFGRDNPVGESESILAPLVKELAPAAPLLVQAVITWLSGQSAAQPLPPVQNAQPAPSEPQQIPSPPPPQPTAEQFVMSKYITGLAQNAPAQEVAAFLAQMENQAVEVKPLITFLIEQEPADVLAFIRAAYPQAAAVTQLPHSENFVRYVQGALFEDTPEGSPNE